MTQEIYTENLADFRSREWDEIRRICIAWEEAGMADGFYEEGIRFAFNRNSGNVFLVNDEYQVAMINPETDKLELWHNCGNCGHEGFKEDCQIDDDNQYCNECKESGEDE